MVPSLRLLISAPAGRFMTTPSSSPTFSPVMERYFSDSPMYSLSSLTLPEILDHVEIASFNVAWSLRALEETGATLKGLPNSRRLELFARYAEETLRLMDFSRFGEADDLISRAKVWDRVSAAEAFLRKRWRHFALCYLARHESRLVPRAKGMVLDAAMAGEPLLMPLLARRSDDYPELGDFLERSWVGFLGAVSIFQTEVGRSVLEEARRDPERVRESLRQFHAGRLTFGDSLLDRLLGILQPEEDYSELRLNELEDTYGVGEQYIYEGTSYAMLRELFQTLPLGAEECFVDLGSGYGRVALYAGLVGAASVIGIELVADRCDFAEAARSALGLHNVRFLRSHVLEADLRKGDVFFLFNPFSRETLRSVGERLRDVADQKPIRIVSWGDSSHFFLRQSEWLEAERNVGDEMTVFRSKLTPRSTPR